MHNLTILYSERFRSGRVLSIMNRGSFPLEAEMKVAESCAAQVTAQIEQMNNMLKMMTGAEMKLDEKMMKVTVGAKINGLGEHIDMFV